MVIGNSSGRHIYINHAVVNKVQWCKFDLEKTYDHVSWDFLLYLLGRCGFGEKWQKWIANCVSTVQFSILVNGTHNGFFNSSRGLRQGGLLYPLLFVIVAEALSRMMVVAVNRGFIFADDALIFCGSAPDQIRYLRCALLCFEATSSLKTSLAKSELVHVGNVPSVSGLARILGCRVPSLPVKYLGLPLGAPFKAKSVWNSIIEKMERKLAGWKRLHLNRGGRVTLVKSTLPNLPTYFLSLYLS
jgi:hypothetical protein